MPFLSNNAPIISILAEDMCMKYEHILKNKPLPEGAMEIVDQMNENGEKILFIIVGDLNLKGKYARTALIFTDQCAVCYDGVPGESTRYRFVDMSDVSSKRMYGNAVLSAVMPDGQRKVIFRYTYSVAGLCDSAALFISHVRDGESVLSENAIMEVAFERALSVCPKCGRTLLHPGAECIMCRSKLKIVKQLSKYVRPQIKLIILCICLALITTAMALVPPMITGFIVDVVFTEDGESSVAILNSISDALGGDKGRVLAAMIGLLLSTYVLQYGIGLVRAYFFKLAGDRSVVYLRNDIYRKAQYLPMRFYDKTSTGSVINRISGDSATLQNFLLRNRLRERREVHRNSRTKIRNG